MHIKVLIKFMSTVILLLDINSNVVSQHKLTDHDSPQSYMAKSEKMSLLSSSELFNSRQLLKRQWPFVPRQTRRDTECLPPNSFERNNCDHLARVVQLTQSRITSI